MHLCIHVHMKNHICSKKWVESNPIEKDQRSSSLGIKPRSRNYITLAKPTTSFLIAAVLTISYWRIVVWRKEDRLDSISYLATKIS